jgi:hypothetical protein
MKTLKKDGRRSTINRKAFVLCASTLPVSIRDEFPRYFSDTVFSMLTARQFIDYLCVVKYGLETQSLTDYSATTNVFEARLLSKERGEDVC